MKIVLKDKTVLIFHRINDIPLSFECEPDEIWSIHIDGNTPGLKENKYQTVRLDANPFDWINFSDLGLNEYFLNDDPPIDFQRAINSLFNGLRFEAAYERDNARSQYEKSKDYLNIINQINELQKRLAGHKQHYTRVKKLELCVDYLRHKTIADLIGLPDDGYLE